MKISTTEYKPGEKYFQINKEWLKRCGYDLDTSVLEVISVDEFSGVNPFFEKIVTVNLDGLPWAVAVGRGVLLDELITENFDAILRKRIPFITVYLPVAGWKAIHHAWNEDDPETGPFLDVVSTSPMAFKTKLEAIEFARQWAKAEDLPYVPNSVTLEGDVI